MSLFLTLFALYVVSSFAPRFWSFGSYDFIFILGPLLEDVFTFLRRGWLVGCDLALWLVPSAFLLPSGIILCVLFILPGCEIS